MRLSVMCVSFVHIQEGSFFENETGDKCLSIVGG
jgi:hypothetical protein